MKRDNTLIIILISIIILNSCNSNPVGPIKNIPVKENTYHQINITQTDYQSFDISNNENFILGFNKISSIILGDKNSGIFNGTDTLIAVYEQAGNKFRLKFNFHHDTDDTTLQYKFTIRYVLIDHSFYDLDTFKVTYKYPYSSTEIFIKWSTILIPPEYDIQAFDFLDSTIYFHPFGPGGLYEYKMKNSHTTLKIHYSGGDYLAASQNYVFLDIYHHIVGRYNIALDSLDLMINLSPNTGFFITGMEVYENKLYVSTNKGEILIFNLDLQSEGMIPYPNSNFSLAIKDNIAYSNSLNQIIRFNLTTQNYINEAALPSLKCDAIVIIDDKMFFTDYAKKIIGYFNLSDL